MAKYKLPKIEDLFESGVHFGHQVRRWDPRMAPYIFAAKSGIHVIDLDKTHEKLQKAADHLFDIAKSGGQIIFVGTKKQAKDIVELEAKRCGALYINERWLGGTITNFRVIKKNMDKLVDYMRKREAGEFSKYTKKERLLLDREIEKLQKDVGGLIGLQGKPSAIFVIDGKRERTAIKEASKTGISVLGLVDTNTNPANIDYVIPGNDDAIRSIALIMKVVADAVEEGYKEFAKKSEKAEVKEEEPKEKTEDQLNGETPNVTSSEAPHTSKEAGEAHIKRVETGTEPVKEAEDTNEKEEKDTAKKEEDAPKKRGRPKKSEK